MFNKFSKNCFQSVFLVILLFLLFFIQKQEILANEFKICKSDDYEYDLEAREIEVVPKKPALNQKVRIIVKVKNKSNLDLCNYDGILNYIASFENFHKDSVANTEVSAFNKIAVNKYIEYVFEGYFTKLGTANLSFVVDESNQLEEEKEDNNTLSKEIIVVEDKKDVEVVAVEFDPEEALIFDEVEVKVRLRNTGTTTLLKDIGFRERDLYITHSGIITKKYKSDTLPSFDNPFEPNDEINFTYYIEFNKENENYFNLKFDALRELKETNEDNNSLKGYIKIHKEVDTLYDFEIKDVELSYVNSSAVKIDWKTSVETDCSIVYKSKKDVFFSNESGKSSNKTEHSIVIEDLRTGIGDYVFKIKAINEDYEKFSDEYDFRLLFDDNIKILDNNIQQIVDNDDKKLNLSFETNYLCSTCVYYKLNTDNEYTEKCFDENNNQHNIIIKKLGYGDYQYYLNLEGLAAKNPALNYSEDDEDLKMNYQSDVYKFSLKEKKENVVNQDKNKEDSNKKQDSKEKKEDDIKMEEITKNVKNKEMYQKLKGKILLKVEDAGKAYYVNPVSEKRHYLGRPNDAFAIMREQGIGISNANLEKIAIGSLSNSSKNIDVDFSKSQAGKIFLQVESAGEAWYINPLDNKRYFLGRPNDAFVVMKNLGLGINNNDFEKL